MTSSTLPASSAGMRSANRSAVLQEDARGRPLLYFRCVATSPIVTIVFTDVVGSTALFDRLGDEAAHLAQQSHLALMASCLDDHGGTLVKTMGDGIMAAFTSALEALQCAIAMQTAAAADPNGLRLRVGLDCGEPIQQNGDYFGNPVIVAKRLCDLADPGQIIASAVVTGVVGRRLESISTASLGRVAVKGLSAPVEAMLVHWRALGESDAGLTKPQISVLIVDDQRLLRAGFTVILNAERDIFVVGEAGDGVEAVAAAHELRPDVIVMDVRMPNMDGLEAARRIVAELPDTKVLMLTTFDADEYVYEALRAGASGFLLKDVPGEQLVAAVRCISSGEAIIDPSITKRLIGQFAQASAPTARRPHGLEELTPREIEILTLLAKGLSNSEIATELFVEETTVKSHVSKVLQKLNLRDRVQAVVYAYESGFIPT